MQFFSERQRDGGCDATRHRLSITIEFWNGLIAVIDEYKGRQAFSSAFPALCTDCNMPYGIEPANMQNKIKSLIPGLKQELHQVYDWGFKIDTGAVFDLIEFLCRNIKDMSVVGSEHEYFHHFHLQSSKTSDNRTSFIEDINDLLRRNSIAFELKETGHIEPLFANGENMLLSQETRAGEEETDALIKEATRHIANRQIEEKRIALEKLWAAFERLKSINGGKKNKSAEDLINSICGSDKAMTDVIIIEFQTLTKIGNSFLIRHSEVGQNRLDSIEFIDYFFFRLYSLIVLICQRMQQTKDDIDIPF